MIQHILSNLKSAFLSQWAYWIILAFIMQVLSIMGGSHFSLLSFLYFIFFMGAIMLSGEQIMRLCDLDKPNHQIEALIIGFGIISIPLTLISLFFSISALHNFCIVVAIILCICCFTLSKKQTVPSKLNFYPIFTLILFATILIFAVFETVSSAKQVFVTHQLHAWYDY